jgi:uncharacterized protein (DUF362 family)
MNAEVAVTKGERGHEPVFKALDLIDYRQAFAERKKVLIKINFICEKTWDTGATTDPVVVEALIEKFGDAGIEVYVVESDATITNADKAYEKTGMKEMCERNHITFLNLRKLKDRIEIPIKGGEVLKKITVPRIVIESAIVSAAKLKTHANTGVTLGMKNMFGLLPEKFKGKYHAMGISKTVVDINMVLKPVLTVIDGFVGMEGAGPINGKPVQMDLIIAGRDVVATDATACRVMEIDPHSVKHVKKAYEKGLGTIDDISVLGERIETVMRRFERA